jgi:predicted RNA-binding protein (virulence factor B family)
MALGKTTLLTVIEQAKSGYLLKEADINNIFLPNDEVTEPLKKNDAVKAFVYKDGTGQLTATFKKPNVELEQFGYLQVKDVNKTGAFMDWGIAKDLLVPYAEQIVDMHKGEWHLIFMLLDAKTNRLIGSCKIDEFVFFDDIDLQTGDEVDLLVYANSDLGYAVIVNNLYKGLIFYSDVHKTIENGDTLKGYVKQVREDGKLDIVLEPLGYKKSIDPTSTAILESLAAHNGCLYLTDKSSPEDIKQQLGLSKKAFKRGLGTLYKQKKIVLLEDCVRLA